MSGLDNYIKTNKISTKLENELISYIERYVKVNPLGVIDWHGQPDSTLIKKFKDNDFIERLELILEKFQSNIEKSYFILQVDDFFPPIQSRLDCWISYYKDASYSDIIFLSADGMHIIHYDFYENLWGKSIYPDECPTDVWKNIENLTN